MAGYCTCGAVFSLVTGEWQKYAIIQPYYLLIHPPSNDSLLLPIGRDLKAKVDIRSLITSIPFHNTVKMKG